MPGQSGRPGTGSRRPTVKDVAAAAGVGVMTVSYTFNQPSRVAEATRHRVLEAAERLGYRRPDSTARALRSGRTGQLGVVLGEHLSYAFDDPQAAQFLAGVAEVCVEEGLGMVLIPTRGDAGDVDRVLAAAVDAYVLWTTSDDDPVLPAVAGSGRPAAIQGGPEHPGITAVSPDDRQAAAALAGAVLEDGRTPVVLSFPLDRTREPSLVPARELPSDIPFPVTRNRLAGYRDALGERWSDTLVAVVAQNHRLQGRNAIEDVLERLSGSSPVILAMSDELALGAREAAGDDAVVTGWDASVKALEAGIVSVTNPLREQGRLCAQAALGPGTGPAPTITWEIADPRRG
ncbi:LacI family DNA-binding transcriptional regulator [Kineosporia rhizophila]|uniref:LacI family DNA-binding transcriptional regulator n=1 Tax=Kineosporia rhizophila TaxID=84633 RepID=UPI001E2B66C8|nr:LacI family DNA-binding transcriptional regulator [Kineosporia rhizophila]